eukprot:2427487-Amphidinium_carterae.1
MGWKLCRNEAKTEAFCRGQSYLRHCSWRTAQRTCMPWVHGENKHLEAWPPRSQIKMVTVAHRQWHFR